MGTPVPCRFAAIGISHHDQVVGGGGALVDRLDRAEHDVDAMLGRRAGKPGRRVIGRWHAPGARIGFRKADKMRTFVGGPSDKVERVGYIGLVATRAMRQRLHDSDPKAHLNSPALPGETLADQSKSKRRLTRIGNIDSCRR